MRPLHLLLFGLLVGGLVACSRSQKSAAAISAQDVAQAMPEFTLVLPPGATNLFLERISQSPATIVCLKLTVPRASLTNFLILSGLNCDFEPMLPGMFNMKAALLPGGFDGRSAANWLMDLRRSSEWNPGKEKAPLRMGVFQTSAKSSPAEQVFMMVLVDDSTNPRATVYLQYIRGPKMR